VAKPTGEYQGAPSSPDTVKKTVTFGGMTIKVDRPKGFIMRGTDDKGKSWERTYQYDYGFIPKTKGGDGEGVDVFLGPHKDAEEAYWVRKTKRDGTFDEYKVFLGFESAMAAKSAFKEHIPMTMFDGITTMKLGLMKAMLGLEPGEKIAEVTRIAFFDELSKLEKDAGLREILTKPIPGTPPLFMGRLPDRASSVISKGTQALKPVQKKTQALAGGVYHIPEAELKRLGFQ